MKIIDGRLLALKVKQELKVKISKSRNTPGLAIVLVGNDHASQTYVRLKAEAAKEIGLYFEKHIFPENARQAEILQTIKQLNQNPKIHGMIVQLPLPKHFNTDEIIYAIDPKKDADGFHPNNLKKLRVDPTALAPVLCQGVWELIESINQDFSNKKALIMANSANFAVPMGIALTRRGLEVNIAYPPFINYQSQAKDADVIIIAIGQAKFLKSGSFKKNSILIDVGFNRQGNKIVGDIDAESAKDLPGWITPVPGGVGPMTVAMLMQRTFELAQNHG
ncbi:MAG: bifunctional 5,10-methylenetetrahydrofolate dehydrogenase/5,10-methenyltetrahydrofolate cyclohydrolase [Patescibacteria group bacterium]|jgi:methylenetetrahydrofolate dehydrogenase (NADP+)/methenyltetrahydrofolate cyclohydrolase